MTLAFIYAGLGETDRTFEMLENAYNNREETLIFIKIDTEFNNLHSDPRFKALLKKNGVDRRLRSYTEINHNCEKMSCTL